MSKIDVIAGTGGAEDRTQPSKGADPKIAAAGAIPAAKPATVAPIDAAMRRRIKAHFEQKYDQEFDRWRALRMSSQRWKWGLGVLCAVLIAGAIAVGLVTKMDYSWLRGLEAYAITLGTLGLVAVGIALSLEPVSELPPPSEVEQAILRTTEHDVRGLLA